MATLTILQIIQKFCQRTGLRVPTSVASSTETQTIQLLALANEVVEDLVDNYCFEALRKETTFVSVATEDQGAITTIAPNGFLYITDDTIYDRTQKIPIYGPVSPQAWQQSKAFVPIGPIFRYRIFGGHLFFNPLPPAGHTCAFEYMSDLCIQNVGAGTFKNQFSADDDTFLLDYTLLLSGLRWKWKAEKGLPYAEEFSTYERQANNAGGRSGSKVRIMMDGQPTGNIEPMIIVPPGSWPLS